MPISFPNLSWLLWSNKRKNAKLHKTSSVKSSPELNAKKLDMIRFNSFTGIEPNLASRTRKVRRKGRVRVEGKIDKELDAVIVSCDGGCSSDSESDASDWSIGWSEPHASGFLSEDEMEVGFAVLVRCYGPRFRGNQDHGKDITGINANVPELCSADKKSSMERWLSSLHSN
ncbi:unnamed protein product [Amaranthus hypochondriacus]